MDCPIPVIEGRLVEHLVKNREDLYWALVACNSDKHALRVLYGMEQEDYRDTQK